MKLKRKENFIMAPRLRNEFFSFVFRRIGFRVVMTGLHIAIIGDIVTDRSLFCSGVLMIFLGSFIMVASFKLIYGRTFIEEFDRNVHLVAFTSALLASLGMPSGTAFLERLLWCLGAWCAWVLVVFLTIGTEHAGSYLEAKFLTWYERKHSV